VNGWLKMVVRMDTIVVAAPAVDVGVTATVVVGVQPGEIVLAGTGPVEPQDHHCAYAEGLESLDGKKQNQVGTSGCGTIRASTTAWACTSAGVQ
jgi:hypothetical protein